MGFASNTMVKKKPQEKKTPKVGYTALSSKAKGDEESLGNNVFDYEQQGKMNQYNKTLEAILSFIGRTYTQPGNVIRSIWALSSVTIPDPPTPTYVDDSTGTDKDKQDAKTKNWLADLEFVEALKETNKKLSILDNNIQASYSLVWG